MLNLRYPCSNNFSEKCVYITNYQFGNEDLREQFEFRAERCCLSLIMLRKVYRTNHVG